MLPVSQRMECGMAQRTAKAAAPVKSGRIHTTTTRLDDATYRRLRHFVTTKEQKTGERLTHQEIFTQALAEYLKANGGD